MKHKTSLSVKKAEKKYGKMPPVIPEVLTVHPGEEEEEKQVKSRLRKLAEEGADNE